MKAVTEGHVSIPARIAFSRDKASLVFPSIMLLVSALLFFLPGHGGKGVCIALMSLSIGILIVKFQHGSFKLLSPIAFVTYCQFVLFVARPAFAVVYQESANIFTGTPLDDGYFYSQLISGAGFIMICIGYSSVRFRDARLPRPLKRYSDIEWRRRTPVLYLIVILGLALYAVYVSSIGFAGFWSMLTTGRSEESRSGIQGSSGYFYSGLQFAFGALILVFLQSSLGKYRKRQLASAILLTASTLPNFASGSRSVFIPVAVAILCIVAELWPKVLRLSRMLVWLPIAFVFLFVAPRIWRDNLAGGVPLVESIKLAFLPENLFGNFFGGLDTAMVDAFSLQVSGQVNGDIPLKLGSSYVSLASGFIPRALWANKPETTDQYLNSSIFPETDAKGIGFAFGFYSEPYLNFGFFGVVVICFAVGFFLARLLRWSSIDGHVYSYFIMIMVVAYIFPIMRGSLTFDSQRLLISLLPVVLFLWINALIGNSFYQDGLSRSRQPFRSSGASNRLDTNDPRC